jgi:integrase
MTDDYRYLSGSLSTLPCEVKAGVLRWLDRKSEEVTDKSMKAIQSDLALFYDFCQREEDCWLPTSKATLRRYVKRYEGIRSNGAIQRLVGYVREVNRELGNPIRDPVLDHELRDLAASGKKMRRSLVRIEQIQEISDALGNGVYESYTRALLWVLYDSQFRISRLLDVRLEDLKVLRPSGVVWLPTPDAPVSWEEDGGFLPPSTACHLRDWFGIVGITKGYIFPRVRKGNATELAATPAHARRIVTTVLQSVEFSGFVPFGAVRQGAISDLFDAEVGLAKVMKYGGYGCYASVKKARAGSEKLDGSSLALAEHQGRWGEPDGY